MAKPLLRLSELTQTVYVVTRYKDLGEGRIDASAKTDVTYDFWVIVEHLRKTRQLDRGNPNHA